MQGKTKERWMSLCEQAAQEQDPDKLMELLQEITMLLDQKQERLKSASQGSREPAGNGQKQ
jgi:hypothetical protein